MRQYTIKIDGELFVTRRIYDIAIKLLRDAVEANGLRYTPKGRRLFVKLWVDFLDSTDENVLSQITDELVGTDRLINAVTEKPVSSRIRNQVKFYITKKLEICLTKLQAA